MNSAAVPGHSMPKLNEGNIFCANMHNVQSTMDDVHVVLDKMNWDVLNRKCLFVLRVGYSESSL